MELTAEILRQRVDYDPETGAFTWRPHPGSANAHRAWDAQWAGKVVTVRCCVAPLQNAKSYGIVRVLGKWYGQHRLAWLWMTGEWPIAEIDHKDGNPLNNRFANLRSASRSQNQANKKAMSNNLLGIKGVYKHRRRYVAQINAGGKHTYLGSFKCPTAASIAFTKAHKAAHGKFSRTSL